MAGRAGGGGTWADLGAGRGTFTRALVEVLGPNGRVIAVDRDPTMIAELEQWATSEAPNVTATVGDFTGTMMLPATPLDGILLANAMHFVKTEEQGAMLSRLADHLADDGRVVLVEYDRRAASRWVPYPIGIARLPELAKAAGLSKFIVSESRPSNYEGIIYTAHADKA